MECRNYILEKLKMEETVQTGFEKLQLYSETRKRLDELYNDTTQVIIRLQGFTYNKVLLLQPLSF